MPEPGFDLEHVPPPGFDDDRAISLQVPPLVERQRAVLGVGVRRGVSSSKAAKVLMPVMLRVQEPRRMC